MKFLEGKTPAERNKIIAAIVLGLVAFLALSYTVSGVLFPPTQKPNSPIAKATPTPVINNPSNIDTAAVETDKQTSLSDLAWMLVTPVTYAQSAFSSDAGRNVFAFYEQPAPTPWVAPPVKTPTPLPPPTPTPTPPYGLAYVTPSMVYAGSKSFRMETGGDRFDSGARIIFNGNELPTNFVSAQKLTVDIPANMVSGQGSAQVMVRNADGTKYSLPMMMQVQAPPVPNYTFIGLIEKKHRDNDMAMLQEKGKTDVASYRLNDPVGDRFRLISISSKEVVLEDKSLGFKHRIAFSDSKVTAGGAGANGSGVINAPFGRGGQGATGLQYVPYNGPNGPNGPNPTMMPPGEIPGIPANAQRNPGQQNVRDAANKTKRDYEDDNDDGGPRN